jgi:hypothetical protein
LPGLTRQFIPFAKSLHEELWIPGSSPGMTIEYVAQAFPLDGCILAWSPPVRNGAFPSI